MTEAIVLGAAVAAGLACPAHMWWSHRRGRQAACCPPRHEADAGDEIQALRTRQARLGALIADYDAVADGARDVEAANRATT